MIVRNKQLAAMNRRPASQIGLGPPLRQQRSLLGKQTRRDILPPAILFIPRADAPTLSGPDELVSVPEADREQMVVLLQHHRIGADGFSISAIALDFDLAGRDDVL